MFNKMLKPTLMDQKKVIDFFFSDNDHKLYLIGQKKTFWDHFFSEEALSEEQFKVVLSRVEYLE